MTHDENEYKKYIQTEKVNRQCVKMAAKLEMIEKRKQFYENKLECE